MLVSGPMATSSRSLPAPKSRHRASTASSSGTGVGAPSSRMPRPSVPNHTKRSLPSSGTRRPAYTGTTARPARSRSRRLIRARSRVSPLTWVTATSETSGAANANARQSASSTSEPMSVSSTMRWGTPTF